MDWDRVTTWWREADKKRLALLSALFIGTFAVTALLRWDMDFTYTVAREQVDAGVYGTLGDVCVFVNVLLLGGPWGAGLSALAMAIADIAVGSKLYVIGTLIIKSGMALFIAAFAPKCDTWPKRFVVAGIAELIMFVAYFFYDLLFVSYSVAVKAVPINLLQAVVCGALGAVVLRYVPLMHPDKMPEIKRRARPGAGDDDGDLTI